MRRTALVCLLLLAACGAPPAPETQPPSPAPATAPGTVEAGTFVLEQGGNPVLTERFTRGADRLEAEFTVPGQGRVAYTLVLGPDATVARMEGRAYPPNDTTPVQRFTAEFRGDSVFSRTAEGDSVRTARTATQPGAVPYLNPSPSLMEQVLRRARALGGDTVRVPVLVIGGGAQSTVPATVTFVPPDSARIVLGPAELRVRTDDAGRLLGGTVPAQGVTIERTGTP